MKKKYLILRALLLLLIAAAFCEPVRGQFYYGITQEYGKNRVQFTPFDWVYYRFEGFDVYFYRGNEQLAEQVARMTNRELPKIEDYLDAPLDERLQILVFNSLTDLKQSNVNSSTEEDYNQQGVTRISGRRMFVYFNGDYTELRRHLRMGLSEVVMANLIYGSFTQSITNSALLDLPAWYTQGLISFIGQRWNTEMDHQVQNGFYTGKYRKINSLTQQQARFAGHSFWHYIAETYGDKVIRNILYMSVINRNIESGFLYILGKNLEQVTEGWYRYYCNRYDLERIEQEYEDLDELVKARKNHELVRMEMAPNGRYLVYVDQRFSRYKIYLHDFQEDKRERLYVGGYRIAQNADYSYPIFAWHPNSEIVAFFLEEEGITKLNFYNLKTEELKTKEFYRFDKILSFRYSSDGTKFLLSATKNGQSDIFVYTILNTKIEQVTNDEYDDLDPTFFDNDKRIAWSSNRPVDTLYPNQDLLSIPVRGNDIFATKAQALDQDTLAIWRMTNSPLVNERGAQEYAPGFISILSDRSGNRNQHLIKIDSSIAYVDTITHYEYNFTEYQTPPNSLNVLDQAYAPLRDKRYDLVHFDKRYRIYERPYYSPEDLNLSTVNSTRSRDKQTDQQKSAESPPVSLSNETALYYPGYTREELAVDITNYQFGTEEPTRDTLSKKPEEEASEAIAKLIDAKPQLVDNEASEQPEENDFDIPPKRNYFLSFYQDEFNVRFDNMFDNLQYQPFTGRVSGNLLNQGFNVNFKVGVMDLMHDYRIIAGMRTGFQPLAGTSLTPNAEFLVGFGDYKKRLDKILTYRRRSQVQFLTATEYRRFISNVVEAKAVWPFNPVASLQGSIGYRLDENILLARDFARIDEPLDFTDYGILRLSYVYDNSRKIGLNLYAGLRFKVFTEYYRNFDISPSGLHTLGADIRNYTIIHRNMVWANRLATGTSFGPEKLIHIMGGVDNDFSPDVDNETPIARENNYIFQTLVTNMRGFFQNARNGNTFAVINSELRWPFISYFANRPIRNDFINNLMVVGFADVGTAWNGPSPYSPENAINTREIPLGNDGLIVLDSQKEPIIVGTGFGLRSRIFGYYVRADWAWGIEDGIVLPNVFYISLNTDF